MGEFSLRSSYLFVVLYFFCADVVKGHSDFVSVISTAKPLVAVIDVDRTKKWFKSSGVNSKEDVLGEYTDFFETGSKNLPKRSRGSGFVLYTASDRPNTLVLTASHVVKGAKEIFVSFDDNDRYKASVLWLNQKNDVAVLEISPTEVLLNKGLKLRSLVINEGQSVLAIGSAFSLSKSSSQGIISAKNVVLPDNKNRSLLQTDAAINPGFSGGPLLDEFGHVAGMITNIYSKTGTFSGAAFAVPSIKIIELLEKNGIK